MRYRKATYPKPKLKRHDIRYKEKMNKVHIAHDCLVCGSDRACYSYDFGKTWYCPEHREKGKAT